MYMLYIYHIYPMASMYGIFTYIYHSFPIKTTINVGRYTSPMDGMGIICERTPYSSSSWNIFFELPIALAATSVRSDLPGFETLPVYNQ